MTSYGCVENVKVTRRVSYAMTVTTTHHTRVMKSIFITRKRMDVAIVEKRVLGSQKDSAVIMGKH